ncbi:dipeptidase PepE [Cellulophaga baltica]|uniref:dipeptidase PepE n=1 Tax=Cellulophaga TaxID=104264 RepID=UPI001C076EFC|nr:MULTISPECIES: dipeptidase PepE [Cellulophaga]MBU2995012.1 dipeptidase PepE [Cellulophaga baltica]MDO6766407.1 dipeptidase PepE [Cellulophaga sp. 1_MG-2023]
MKNLLLASTSTLHGQEYLAYLLDDLKELYATANTIIFIPFARPSGISHDDYTAIAAKAFAKINKKIIGLHTFKNPIEAIQNAEAIFTGGGNTFLLVKQLYELQIMAVLKQTLENGTPYLGTSAGSNIAGLTMKTTNDMPIVYPPSFETLGMVNFNINAHYLDPDPNSTHKGETRETRIKEFHNFNSTPVIGLREGSFIRVKDSKTILKGDLKARIFLQNKEPYESLILQF